MSIKLLELVFQMPTSVEEVAEEILRLSPEFDEMAGKYPDQQGQLANRVLETARAVDPSLSRRKFFIDAAKKAHADEGLKDNTDAVYWVRQMGIRNGTIDPLNPAHDLQYMIKDEPSGFR